MFEILTDSGRKNTAVLFQMLSAACLDIRLFSPVIRENASPFFSLKFSTSLLVLLLIKKFRKMLRLVDRLFHSSFLRK